MTELELFYLNPEEDLQACYLALREIILSGDQDVQESYKYGLPFFDYRSKMLCYLWRDKKDLRPYVGFCQGKYLNYPQLVLGNRKSMKVWYIDVSKDIPANDLICALQDSMTIIDDRYY